MAVMFRTMHMAGATKINNFKNKNISIIVVIVTLTRSNKEFQKKSMNFVSVLKCVVSFNA